MYSKNHIPSHFFLLISPKREAISDTVVASFSRLCDTRFSAVSISLPSCLVSILYSESAAFYGAEEGSVSLLVHGTVYDLPAGPAQGGIILERYERTGDEMFAGINRSAALIIMDSVNDRVFISTDRLNTRKVFMENDHGEISCFSSFETSCSQKTIDTAGMASFLSCGYFTGPKTLFRECSRLQGASVYRYENGILTHRVYWDFALNSASEGNDERKIRSEYAELLIDSVRKRIPRHAPIVLSLSGGYDSSAILGILTRLKVPDVLCVSYKYGPAFPSSDEYISNRMAAVAGYPHRYMETYTGELLPIFRQNAAVGQCLTVCDEALVWERLAAEYPSGAKPCIFVADQCFGDTVASFRSAVDHLNELGMYEFSFLSPLFPYISDSIRSALEQSYARNFEENRKFFLTNYGNDDLVDYLYVNLRLTNLIVTWRENYLGSYGNVENPFLDYPVIDAVAAMPTSLRKGKWIFKKTVKRLFPELFSLPRARTASFVSYLHRGIRENRRQLEECLSAQSSSLDEIIPLSAVRRLIADVCMEEPRTHKETGLKNIASRIKQSLYETKARNLVWKLKKITPPSSLDGKILLLKRLFILRFFLEKHKVSLSLSRV